MVPEHSVPPKRQKRTILTTIYVDADACPVKEETIRVGERHGLKVVFVANGGLRPSRNPLVEIRIVSQGADAADDWIADNISDKDICITADIPLASRSLAKGARVIRPDGRLFDDANIGVALAVRGLNQHLREANQVQTYNAAFSKADRSAFLDGLHRLVLSIRNSER